MYYSRPSGQAFLRSVSGPPFSSGNFSTGPANANATFQTPFRQPFPTPESYPTFPAYSPLTAITVNAVSPDFRPALIQQFGLNVQNELVPNLLLEMGYVGTRGSYLMRARLPNQALNASPSNPVRGQTSNTIINIPLRVPILGHPPASLFIVESSGNSWYNGLEVSLTKHSHGLQVLASYTFSSLLIRTEQTSTPQGPDVYRPVAIRTHPGKDGDVPASIARIDLYSVPRMTCRIYIPMSSNGRC